MKLLAIIEAANERRHPQRRPMAEPVRAISRWTAVEPIFVIRGSEADFQAIAREIHTQCPNGVAIWAPESVMGSACMAMLAADHLNDQELCIVEGEQQLRWDLQRRLEPLRHAGVDAGAVVFESLHLHWPQVRLSSDGEVLEVEPIASTGRNALAGLYYFRRGVEFRQAVEQMILKRKPTGRGFELAPVLNESILAGKRVAGSRLAATEELPEPCDEGAREYREMIFTIDRSQAAAMRDKWFARAA